MGEKNELDSYYYIFKCCKTINNWPTAVLCGRGCGGGRGGGGGALKSIPDPRRLKTSRRHCKNMLNWFQASDEKIPFSSNITCYFNERIRTLDSVNNDLNVIV